MRKPFSTQLLREAGVARPARPFGDKTAFQGAGERRARSGRAGDGRKLGSPGSGLSVGVSGVGGLGETQFQTVPATLGAAPFTGSPRASGFEVAVWLAPPRVPAERSAGRRVSSRASFGHKALLRRLAGPRSVGRTRPSDL